jgi:hypothetical protein
MAQAYMDESGIHDKARFCIVAGYVASPTDWYKFGKEWRRVLKKFCVPVEFHAQRFWTRDGFGRRVDEYQDWSDQKANAYVNALLTAVKKHDLYMLGSVMPVDLFFKYGEDDRRYLTGAKVEGGKFKTTGKPTAPYFLPFQHCIIEAAHRFERSAKIDYFFDQNEQLSGWATTLYQDLRSFLKVSDRLGELKYADSKTSAPLQAADLVCFELKECVEKSKDVMKLEASYVLRHATKRGAQVKIFDERVIKEILSRPASLDQRPPGPGPETA